MKANAIERLFVGFDEAFRASGYIPMSGQIVDASLVAAPKQAKLREDGSLPAVDLSRCSVIRAMSRSIAVSASFASGGQRCRCLPRTAAAPRLARRDQYGKRRMGRYRLSLAEERDLHRPQRLCQPHSPQEAQGQADAGSRQRQVSDDCKSIATFWWHYS